MTCESTGRRHVARNRSVDYGRKGLLRERGCQIAHVRVRACRATRRRKPSSCDVARDRTVVNVGVSHDTAAFAVETIRPCRLRLTPRARVRGVSAGSPASAVEVLDLQRGQVHAIEAADIHVVPFGMSPRAVEARDAAVAAEVVTRLHGPELVGREIVAAGKQAEALRGNLMVEVSQPRADGTVALACPREVGRDLEADTPAVAPARVGLHGPPATSRRRSIRPPVRKIKPARHERGMQGRRA